MRYVGCGEGGCGLSYFATASDGTDFVSSTVSNQTIIRSDRGGLTSRPQHLEQGLAIQNSSFFNIIIHKTTHIDTQTYSNNQYSLSKIQQNQVCSYLIQSTYCLCLCVVNGFVCGAQVTSIRLLRSLQYAIHFTVMISCWFLFR